MRKLLTVLLFFGWVFQINAQAPYTEFKVGMLDPKATARGFLFGIHLGRTIDESLSWGLELNYFQRTYREEQEVQVQEEGQARIVTKQRTLDFTTRILPLILKLNWERQLAPRSGLFLRASGGLGWELAWNSENNFVEQVKRTSFFHGFGWQVSAGVGLGISSSGNFFVDVFYNGSTLKRNQKVNELGLPTWEELDVSGPGIKVGVSIVGFGW